MSGIGHRSLRSASPMKAEDCAEKPMETACEARTVSPFSALEQDDISIGSSCVECDDSSNSSDSLTNILAITEMIEEEAMLEQESLRKQQQLKEEQEKHFVGDKGPSEIYPDPLAADGRPSTPSRPTPKKRRLQEISVESNTVDIGPGDNENIPLTEFHEDESTQTDENWISPLTILSQSEENDKLQTQLEKAMMENGELHKKVLEQKKIITELEEKLDDEGKFGFDSVCRREGKLKNLFQYYTGLKLLPFLALLEFLVPVDTFISYSKSGRDVKRLAPKDCLFLCLCRLRHNFGLKDISMRFGLSLQSSSDIFDAWIEHMYLKLGQLNIWPHRDIIIDHMPAGYKKEFPTSLIIIGSTEIKTQSPCTLTLQSQMYSDSKSNTTLKCLVGCDPRGSVMFISELFTGSVSDKELTSNSGFYDLLKSLKEKGYILKGDAVMADKGFTTGKELEKLGLKLNIPPFASSASQMSPGDTELTQKIARHRILIERVISKIKNYKIVFHTIPTSLFQNINQIWSVCCLLTLFQDIFVKDK